MSGYYSQDDAHRQHRRARRPVYEEKVIESRGVRGAPVGQTALVRRERRDSSSSVEEIDRQFVPGNGAYVQRRSTVRDRYGHDQWGPPRPRSVDENSKVSRRSRRGGGGSEFALHTKRCRGD